MEKVRARGSFHGEDDTSGEPEIRRRPAAERRALYQSGTDGDAFFRDGPRLTSAYAAQVIGQALALPGTASAPRAGYAKPRLRAVTRLDERV